MEYSNTNHAFLVSFGLISMYSEFSSSKKVDPVAISSINSAFVAVASAKGILDLSTSCRKNSFLLMFCQSWNSPLFLLLLSITYLPSPLSVFLSLTWLVLIFYCGERFSSSEYVLFALKESLTCRLKIHLTRCLYPSLAQSHFSLEGELESAHSSLCSLWMDSLTSLCSRCSATEVGLYLRNSYYKSRILLVSE